MNFHGKNTKLTRREFEGLFAGGWIRMRGDRYRQNGDFKTYLKNGKKVFAGKSATIQAVSWFEIALALGLVDKNGKKAPPKMSPVQRPKDAGKILLPDGRKIG